MLKPVLFPMPVNQRLSFLFIVKSDRLQYSLTMSPLSTRWRYYDVVIR